MTNQQVIEAANNDSTKDCTSSSLRWYGRNKTLLYLDKECGSKDTNKWKIGMLFFDGVLFYNKEFCKHSSRYADSNKYDNIVTSHKSNGSFCVEMRCLDMVEVNTRKLKSNWDYLTEYFRKSIPVKDFDLYWTWVWQYPLTSFAKQINDYHITIEGCMTQIEYSEQFQSMKQVLNIFNDVNVNGDIHTKVDTLRTMLENLKCFNDSLERVKRHRHQPYSQMDYDPSRARIRLSNPFEGPFVDNSDKTLWARSKQQTDLYYGRYLVRFEFPEHLFEHWDKLMAVFERCGFPEPHPFGLKFSKDNIKTLAALYDTALNDEKNPNQWYEYNTSNDLPSDTTTQSYPTTLLA
jgi:hypothetical protein